MAVVKLFRRGSAPAAAGSPDDAVLAERARIARELHDIVAHGMSVIVIQADAARTVLDADPEQAKASLDSIAGVARDSMDQIRRVVDALRDGDPGQREPQPGLGDVPALVDGMREAGLGIDLVVTGKPRAIQPLLDTSAYRIVQEALTNVLKHAGPVATRVAIDHVPGEIRLAITNDGPTVADDPSPGHGLIGMQERVAIFDGELDAGPRPEGGWRVSVRLPAAPTFPAFVISRSP